MCRNPKIVLEVDAADAEFAADARSAGACEVRLGEPVCLRRWRRRHDELLAAVRACREAGLTVSISTPAILMSDEEVNEAADRATACVCAGASSVVANNLGTMYVLGDRGSRAFDVIAGTFLNSYNHLDVNVLAERGAARVCLPHELRREEFLALLENVSTPIEILVHGAPFVAVSRRCYESQLKTGDPWKCAEVCSPAEALHTLSDGNTGRDTFRIMGRSLLSSAELCLLAETRELADAGAGYFRIACFGKPIPDCLAVLSRYAERLAPTAENQPLAVECPSYRGSESPRCNGWYYSEAGLEWIHRGQQAGQKIDYR